MKYVVGTIFFLLITFYIKAQTVIQFRCYLKSSCNTSITELKEYSLRKDSFFYSSLNSGIVANLPDTGYYVLESSSIATEGEKITIHINVGLNVDTIRKKDILDVVFLDSKPLKGMSQGGGWLCCGKPCEGYKVDYYDNGQKRIEGKFKKGKPMGELKFYNESGKLNYVEYYNKRGRKLKSEFVKI